MKMKLARSAWMVVFSLCFFERGEMFAQESGDTSSANSSKGQLPVAHVAVVARNPVERLRELARQKDGSCQVFLWRAAHYLEDQFKDASFEAVQKILEDAGAAKIDEWGNPDWPEPQVKRYAIVQDIIKSRAGQTHAFVVEVRQYGKSPSPQMRAYILVKFGLPFETVAGQRDYPKGTVLDRVFGLPDLEEQARETTQLDSIEMHWGPVGSIGGMLGWGFLIDVELSDPTGRGRRKWQKIGYMVCSGLEPLDDSLSNPAERKPEVHVARDVLIPGVSPWSLHEHGYPGTFISNGSEYSERESPAK